MERPAFPPIDYRFVFVRSESRFQRRPCEPHAVAARISRILWTEEKLVGAVGIEPTTFGLKGRCSTTELRP
jgi:hypothetical protein